MSVFFDDDDPDFEKPAPRRRARRSPLRRVLLVLMSVAAVVAIGIIGASALYVKSVDSTIEQNLKRADQMPAETPTEAGASPRPTKKAVAEKAVNVVLIGSDSRTTNAGQGRSDVLMVAHLAGDRESAQIISFPRDMWVDIPGHGKNKINAAYAFGGPQLTVRTLEGLLHTRMDHVAVIDFEGFINVTTALGGVTVDNPHPSVSQGYNFPKGRITIEGAEALAYVRERKQLPRGDLDRAERQRLVVQAILRKGLSKDVISRPAEFNKFVAAISQSATVDNELTNSEIRKIATSVRMGPGDISDLEAPISGFGTSPGGASIDVVDQAKLDELAVALADDDMAAYVEKYPNG